MVSTRFALARRHERPRPSAFRAAPAAAFARGLAAFALMLAALAPAPAAAQLASPAENFTLQIHLRARTIGGEQLWLQEAGDSLVMIAASRQSLGVNASDSLIKNARTVSNAFDLDLQAYASRQSFRDHRYTQGLVLRDTVYTLYAERDGVGVGDTFLRPPGRIFVLDTGTFGSFELICRMLRGRAFDSRVIHLLVLGTVDTMLTDTLTDRGAVQLRLAGRTVPARRFTIGRLPMGYSVWMSPAGHLLRLEHAPSGLRVERVAAPARRTPRAHPR